MDSTFLGTLAGFGLMTNPGAAEHCDIELLNPSARVSELLENLSILQLFKITTGTAPCPPDATPCEPETGHHTREEITRNCIEAHQALMAANPENVAALRNRGAVSGGRFKEPTKPAAKS